jgi:hypothetical protein
MKWSGAKPKNPGYYWVKCPSDKDFREPAICQIVEKEAWLEIRMFGKGVQQLGFWWDNCYWAGPVKLPDELKMIDRKKNICSALTAK